MARRPRLRSIHADRECLTDFTLFKYILSKQLSPQREQLAQKEEKRARTRVYKCISPVTGRWLPIFSQGWRVCVNAPCTDEPRIRLRPEDIIKVTRFRRHWLFGERVLSEQEQAAGSEKKSQRKGPIRGWFPRRSVVALTEVPDSESSDDIKPVKSTTSNGHTHGKQQQRNGHTKKYM